jgi:hypothetical protein
MKWTQARPLRTAQGHALATEIADQPLHGHPLVTGALAKLNGWEEPEGELAPEVAEVLLEDYLRGMAAVAIVADAAQGAQEFTGPEDFAVNGRAVGLLAATDISLGLLMQAGSAGFVSKWAAGHLEEFTDQAVLDEHRACVRRVREALAAAAQRQLKG